MQPQKDNRASCTECQRRKQKCSREWPCNHCQARKVPHLCQFGLKKAQQEYPPESVRESFSDTKGQKRSRPESAQAASNSPESESGDPGHALKNVWGYMPGHVHYKVDAVEHSYQRKECPSEATISDTVDKVLHTIPPRSITDAFVNHFLTVVNYRYSSIYVPSFTDQYVHWWADRAVGKPLSPQFTCLLLRVCAHSVQYLTPALRKMVEFELACNPQTLTERLASAADELSQNFVASNTNIERVQEQFLKGAWLKSESKVVESWHALGRTIREAQELGIDKDVVLEGLSEFDIEIRRRLWTLLYVWDWQMSAWLGRPKLIDQKNLTFQFPTLRLDQSTTEPNVLSPFAHIALQGRLGRLVAAAMRETQPIADLSAKQVLAIESECETFIEELPAIFRVTDPDVSYDKQHPYFIIQRHQLHCVIFITMLDFLKPYLTRDRRDKIGEHDDEFRKMGIDIALHLLKVTRDLFDHDFPTNARFHMIVFSVFDTATVLCSAIIHDQDHVLPHREAIMNEIESALGMLHQLSHITKLGSSSYNFLHKLVLATPELSRHSRTGKRQKQGTSSLSTLSSSRLTDSLPPVNARTEHAVETTSTGIELLPSMGTTDDLSFDLDQFLAQNPFGHLGDTATLDMGGIEQMWDWADLHLDGFSNNESVYNTAS